MMGHSTKGFDQDLFGGRSVTGQVGGGVGGDAAAGVRPFFLHFLCLPKVESCSRSFLAQDDRMKGDGEGDFYFRSRLAT